MKLVSVNVGLPREVNWKGRRVTTGIFKEAVAERVMVRALNLDGDRQADLTVHGGVDKAVYAYPLEHYDYWRQQFPDLAFHWGMFGENLTTQELLENEVNIGDRFRIGTVVIMVTQPRFPCYKLNIKFGRDEMVKRFLASQLTGIYFSVTQEGEMGSGDAIELISRDEHCVTVADITRLFVRQADDSDLLHRALQVPALAPELRDYFEQKLKD